MTWSIQANLEKVRGRLEVAAKKVSRDPGRITLVVVSKQVDHRGIRQAVEAGATVLGENRVQEAAAKIPVFGGRVRWHLVGHLQRNKVRQAVGRFDLIHSVDSLPLARELDRRAEQAGLRQRVLVQVNVGREPGKHGVLPEDLEPLVQEVMKMPHLSLEGLMAIPPRSDHPEDSRPHFRWLADQAKKLRESGLPIHQLSMGMSDDFEVAIEEGATLVRVGTAIFGPRELKPVR